MSVPVPIRAWVPDTASCPAGFATVGSPVGSRATVGAWVIEPMLSPRSSCTGGRDGTAGFVLYDIWGADTPPLKTIGACDGRSRAPCRDLDGGQTAEAGARSIKSEKSPRCEIVYRY